MLIDLFLLFLNKILVAQDCHSGLLSSEMYLSMVNRFRAYNLLHLHQGVPIVLHLTVLYLLGEVILLLHRLEEILLLRLQEAACLHLHLREPIQQEML